MKHNDAVVVKVIWRKLIHQKLFRKRSEILELFIKGLVIKVFKKFMLTIKLILYILRITYV